MGVVKIGTVTIYTGDCLEVLPEISGVSGVLTDPPYGLSFMGKAWDKGVPGIPFWDAIGRACLPGAHLLAFGGTRTYHRQTCAIEDAGWTVRDCLMWVYGSGFPKSHNISIAIDKAAGAEREVVGQYNAQLPGGTTFAQDAWSIAHRGEKRGDITAPATPNAHTWQGYGTALKPALEPIVLAQKPREGSFVDNVLTHGCGALNVDGCRVGEDMNTLRPNNNLANTMGYGGSSRVFASGSKTGGRWPSNVLIDDSPEVVGLFPSTGPSRASFGRNGSDQAVSTFGLARSSDQFRGHNDNGGSAARFYYCAKASRAEREAGCWDVPPMKREEITGRKEGSAGQKHGRSGITSRGDIHNSHPTVKPVTLIRYLLRLITQPERNLILDPFAGSGTTGIACALAGIPCVLIEQDPHHVEIIKARIQWATDIRQRLGREPDLDLTPYQTKPEPKDNDQGSLF